MANHAHLLIETPSISISKIMEPINLTYTQYFNKKYGKVGHLLQGRYKPFFVAIMKNLMGMREHWEMSLIK